MKGPQLLPEPVRRDLVAKGIRFLAQEWAHEHLLRWRIAQEIIADCRERLPDWPGRRELLAVGLPWISGQGLGHPLDPQGRPAKIMGPVVQDPTSPNPASTGVHQDTAPARLRVLGRRVATE